MTGSAPEVCPSCGEKFRSKSSQVPSSLNLSDEFNFLCANCLEDCRDFGEDAEIRRLEMEEEHRSAIQSALSTGDWSEVPVNAIEAHAAQIILTTSFFVAQKEIEQEIEVITAECVFGMNIFRDVFAEIRDIFGGRSKASQKVLRDARRTALGELRREALMVGADAVIGIDLDYQEISGGGKGGMLMVVASGTAVKTSKMLV